MIPDRAEGSAADKLMAAERAENRLAFLLKASEILHSSLDTDTTIANVTELAVARYADWCAVYLLNNEGRIRPVSVSHSDPSQVRMAHQLLKEYPPDTNEHGSLSRVIRTGRSELYQEITEKDIQMAARDDDHLRVLKQLNFGSAMIVPLDARGKTLGVMQMVTTRESNRRFDSHDLSFAEDLARRAALAIDNSLLHQEVQDTLERLNRALNAGKMGTWEWNKETGEIHWSPQMEKLFGVTSRHEPVDYKMFFGALHPADRHAVETALMKIRESHRSQELEYRVIHSDGSVHWILGNGGVIEFDPAGEPVRFAGTCVEITDRKLTENRLILLNQELSAVILSSPLGIVSMDIAGRVTEWNPAAERLTGWKREEVIGRLNPMFPDQRGERDHRILERLQQGEFFAGLVVRRWKRDGTPIDLSKWAAPLKDSEGRVRGFVAIYMDVTDRTRFLQVASHELGNPIVAIRTLCTILRKNIVRGVQGESLLNDVQTLEKELSEFSSLLDEIVTAFRTHQGRLPFKSEIIDAKNVLQEAVERHSDPDHQVVFEARTDAAWIRGDVRRLNQLLGNLLSNAAKYSAPGTEIRVGLEVTPETALFIISDQGIGIPEEELPLIFEDFYRVERDTSSDTVPDSGGMGLGLFICREIALQHDGRIWAESTSGEGSTFYVEIPLAKE